MLTPINILAAIVIAMLVLSASVTFTLFDRAAFARMQDQIDLSGRTGFSEEEILANYNALIEYNSIFFTGELNFPTLPMSDSGRIHFEEVKVIFSIFQIILIVSAVISIILCILLFRKKRIKFLVLGGILSLAIPIAVICIMALVGWDKFFVLFHQLFFNNEFWVFDYTTDPVILILPDEWFLNCLVRIVSGIVISSACLIAAPLAAIKIREKTS
jgi:integral membrane protein TIGR01906